MTIENRTMRDLIQQLDAGPERAEEAQAELEELGPEILVPLLDSAPGFGRLGQLRAIELLEGLGDSATSQGAARLPHLDENRPRGSSTGPCPGRSSSRRRGTPPLDAARSVATLGDAVATISWLSESDR